MPMHAYTSPHSAPPSIHSVLSVLLSPICSSTTLHMHTHTLLLLHEKLPPIQSSLYWVLISFTTRKSSHLSAETPFQCLFVSRMASVNQLTLSRMKLHTEYFKPVTLLLQAFPLPSLSIPSLLRATPQWREETLSRYFSFSGTLYSSHSFFKKNNRLLALCMNQDKVGAMAIYLGLPLWPPFQRLGQKNWLMARYCLITYYICVSFLLLWKKRQWRLYSILSHSSRGRVISRATVQLGDSLKSLMVLCSFQNKHGLLYPRFICRSSSIYVAEDVPLVF